MDLKSLQRFGVMDILLDIAENGSSQKVDIRKRTGLSPSTMIDAHEILWTLGLLVIEPHPRKLLFKLSPEGNRIVALLSEIIGDKDQRINSVLLTIGAPEIGISSEFTVEEFFRTLATSRMQGSPLSISEIVQTFLEMEIEGFLEIPEKEKGEHFWKMSLFVTEKGIERYKTLTETNWKLIPTWKVKPMQDKDYQERLFRDELEKQSGKDK